MTSSDYMDLYTGEVRPRSDLYQSFVEEYDGDDPTNAISFIEWLLDNHWVKVGYST